MLIDPNDGSTGEFEVFGSCGEQAGDVLAKLGANPESCDRDFSDGYLFNRSNNHFYPIASGVLSLLSDSDLDVEFYKRHLAPFKTRCPETHSAALQSYLLKLESGQTSTADGNWNRDEMAYYDEAVSSESKRKEFLDDIRANPLWNIFLEREHKLIRKLPPDVLCGTNLLEVGCGNARTMSWIFPPAENGYRYFGVDISFDRLILAKMVLPDGDFIQASALNLPFRDQTFSVAIAFGSIHHLPNQLLGIENTMEKLDANGYFLFHEPIDKPTKVFEHGRLEGLREILEGYEHSDHDNEIDLDQVRHFFSAKSVKIVDLHATVTAFRTVTGKIMKLLPGKFAQQKPTWKAIISIDDFLVRLLCRRPNIFGPGAVFGIVQKLPSEKSH